MLIEKNSMDLELYKYAQELVQQTNAYLPQLVADVKAHMGKYYDDQWCRQLTPLLFKNRWNMGIFRASGKQVMLIFISSNI